MHPMRRIPSTPTKEPIMATEKPAPEVITLLDGRTREFTPKKRSH